MKYGIYNPNSREWFVGRYVNPGSGTREEWTREESRAMKWDNMRAVSDFVVFYNLPNAYVWQWPELDPNTVSELERLAAKYTDVFGVNPVVCSGPMNCDRCNMKNDFAAPNQANGTYRCYECRS